MTSSAGPVRHWINYRSVWVWVAAVAVLLLLACMTWLVNIVVFSGEYEVSLAKGYTLVRLDPDAVAVVRGDDFIVNPNVVRIGLTTSTIVGQVERPLHEFYSDWNSVPGYFVVDLETAAVHCGLDETTCKQVIKDRNEVWPVLYSPDSWRLRRSGL